MAEDGPKGWIVDTNVISRQGGAVAPIVETWIRRNAALIRLSVVTLAEVRRGLILVQAKVDKLQDIRARRRDQAILDAKSAWYGQLRGKFATRLIAIDAEVAERWADVSVRYPSIRDGDKVILATAMVHGLGIATRNLRDFKSSGIVLVDPFDQSTW